MWISLSAEEWGNPLFPFCLRVFTVNIDCRNPFWSIGRSYILNSPTIKSIVEGFATSYLEENGLTLVDVEYVKEGSNWFLRIYVDKEGGIDIDDCGRVSEFVSAKLDELDPI